jgi:signal transduction histidine kinase
MVAALNRYRRLDDGYRGCEPGRRTRRGGDRQRAQLSGAAAAAEELAELDRAKTTFFSNISHEFRTPLTLILGPLAELRGRTDGVDESMRSELEVIHRNGLRLAKLVNTLLDFSASRRAACRRTTSRSTSPLSPSSWPAPSLGRRSCGAEPGRGLSTAG